MTEKLISLLNKIETEYDKPKLLDDIPAIVAEIKAIFASIKKTNNLEEAQPYFDFLMEDAYIPIARMRFLYELDIGDELAKFIYDFDRIDALRIRKEIYDGIKNSTYSLKLEDEEITTYA
jgi:hypothetical protein